MSRRSPNSKPSTARRWLITGCAAGWMLVPTGAEAWQTPIKPPIKIINSRATSPTSNPALDATAAPQDGRIPPNAAEAQTGKQPQDVDANRQNAAQKVASPAAAPTPSAASTGKPPAGAAATGGPLDQNALEKYLFPDTSISVRTASFQGITPGVSTSAELLEKRGEPKEKSTNNSVETWTYSIGPFPRVLFEISAEKVQHISMDLKPPRPLADVETELQLNRLRRAWMFSDAGVHTGYSYPERGMCLKLDTDKESVHQIILRTVNADDFLARVRYDDQLQYRNHLLDLQQILALQPGNEDAILMRSHIVDLAGFTALAHAQLLQAQQSGIDTPRLQIELARLDSRLGDVETSRGKLEKVLSRTDLAALVRAQALRELAAVNASARIANYKQAVDYDLQAIQTASTLTKEGPFVVRREARHVIFQAHLGVAQAIARGSFSNKADTVTKWIANARSLGERMIDNDRAPEAIRLEVPLAALRAFAAMDGAIDPQEEVEALKRQATSLLDAEPDELLLRNLRASYGEGLLDAARIYQRRGAMDLAESTAREAAEVLAEVAQSQPPHPLSELLLGRAYFLCGILEAVVRQDHEAATDWFDRAWPLLGQPLPAGSTGHAADVGDEIVSMGLSYWQAGEQLRGIEATQKGVALLQSADHPPRTDASLAVAYENLSAMHQALGRFDEANKFAELARQFEPAKKTLR